MENIGELIVGAYLQEIEGCDFVIYNTRLPGGGQDGLRELDVVGLKLKDKVAYLCEVTTHIGGMGYQGGNPGAVKKIKEKHASQKKYAAENLEGFQHRFMFWSPYVPVGYITEHLEKIESLELVINVEYTARIEKLQAKAKATKHQTSNAAFRMLQILAHLRQEWRKVVSNSRQLRSASGMNDSREKKFAQAAVRMAVCKIPRGRLTTFGDISCGLTESTDSSRAVSSCISAIGNDFGDDYMGGLKSVPLHRVVDADGFVGGAGNADETDKTHTMNADALKRELKFEAITRCKNKDGEWKWRVNDLQKYRYRK